MTPDPKALAVALDSLRACFGDDSDVLRWAQNPDAVRELLKHTPTQFDPMNAYCAGCGSFHDLAHKPACPVAAAWRALGDPRGAEDIERAHEEAIRAERRRTAAPLTEAQRAELVAAIANTREHMTMEQIGIAAEAIARGDVIEFTHGGPSDQAIRVRRPFRLASESEQAAQRRGIGSGRCVENPDCALFGGHVGPCAIPR